MLTVSIENVSAKKTTSLDGGWVPGASRSFHLHGEAFSWLANHGNPAMSPRVKGNRRLAHTDKTIEKQRGGGGGGGGGGGNASIRSIPTPKIPGKTQTLRLHTLVLADSTWSPRIWAHARMPDNADC